MKDIGYLIETQKRIAERLLQYKQLFGKERIEADYGFEHYILRVIDGGTRLEFWKHGCEYSKRTDIISDFELEGYLSFAVSGNGHWREILSYPELELRRSIEGMAEYPHVDARWSCPEGKLKSLQIKLDPFTAVRYLEADGAEKLPPTPETDAKLLRCGLPQKLLDARYVLGESVDGLLAVDCAKEIDALIVESELAEFFTEFDAATAAALADRKQIQEFLGKVRSSRIGRCAGRAKKLIKTK